MGGKGVKRREKNYRAAHGGNNRLPPPPVPSSLDALPSKLRKLISLTRDVKAPSEKNRGTNNAVTDKAIEAKDDESKVSGLRREINGRSLREQHSEHGDKRADVEMQENKKKKRKRNKVDDLRFEAADAVTTGSKRKERKKQRSEERKKKHKKVRAEADVDFPGHEIIKFGEVVEAPPKLVAFPKPLKHTHDASLERLRLRAVEDYRKRKGWTSRPGIQLPPPATASPMI